MSPRRAAAPGLGRGGRAVLAIMGTALCLALALAQVDLRELAARLAATDARWLVLAALLGPLQVGLAAVRWHAVSRALAVPLGRGQAVAEVALSTLLNQLLPGGVAGDALRVWRHGRRGPGGAPVGLGAALRAAVLDRAVGLGTLALACALAAAVWAHQLPAAPPPWGAALAVLVGLGAVALAPRAVPAVGALGAGARAVVAAGGGGLAVGLSVLLVLSFVVGFELSARAVGLSTGLWLWCAAPWLLLAMALPIAVGGWGPRELAAVVLLPRLGTTPTEAVALTAVYGLSVLIGALPGAAVPLLAGRR